MTGTSTRLPDDEVEAAMTRLTAADPAAGDLPDELRAGSDHFDADSASVRGDRGRHRSGRLRRVMPVLVAAVVVLIVAAGVATLPRVIGSPTAGSKPTPIGLTASPNPSYRIPKGDRLPAITRVDVTETLKGGKPTRKGQLPEDVARSIVAHLNNDATSAEGGAVEMDCPMRVGPSPGDPSYEAVYEPQFDLTLYNGGTDVASVGLGGECTKLVMTVDDGDYNYVITGGQEQVVVDELKRATSPPSASPSPSAASTSGYSSYRIPKGDRLPAITGVQVTETRTDGIRTVLGLLPESVARNVVQQFNHDKAGAARTTNVEPGCTDNVDPNGWVLVYPEYALTFYGGSQGKPVATATTGGKCDYFDLTVGSSHWHANPARPGGMARAIFQAFPRPAAELPQPTSIDVGVRNEIGPAGPLGTLTGTHAHRVWDILTSLPVQQGVPRCPSGGPTFMLTFRLEGRAYATAQVHGYCLFTSVKFAGTTRDDLQPSKAVVDEIRVVFGRKIDQQFPPG